MNEFDYINKYFKPLTGNIGRNLKDDAAVFKQNSNHDLIISTDTLVEGVHFFGTEHPADIAKKSLRVNLSDMASMGAKPLFYNLSLSIPKNKVDFFIPNFYEGLKEDQEIFNLELIGGDLTSSPSHINITITIFGQTQTGSSISRSGAKNGDLLFVSGVLGLSKIGLDNFNKTSNHLSIAQKKYLIPQPRVSLGLALNDIVNSMIDISDGLIQDANHLAVNSGLSVHIDLNKIPCPDIQNISNDILLEAALYGGDDYELLFSCDQEKELLIEKISKNNNIKITKIGYFDIYKDEFLMFQNNSEIPKDKSYLHF
jgi:thiamine-monophosphate kinase